MEQTKGELRKTALALRDRLSPEKRYEKSLQIVEHIRAHRAYQEAAALLVYASFRSEVETFSLMEQAFADGKAVFAPKVLGREMEFYRIRSLAELSPGCMGIPEPEPDLEKSYPVWKNEQEAACLTEEQMRVGAGAREDADGKKPAQARGSHTLLCMPGVAFDRAGHRIGYGGGYYDRYLKKEGKEPLTTMALAFSCQLFDEIPTEPHDMRPACIVTEREAFSVS